MTREVSKTLGVSRLSFGDADALARLLHTHPGAVSPLGLLFPESAGVRLLCDEDLRPLPALAFHPLTNEASLTMSTADFFGKFLPRRTTTSPSCPSPGRRMRSDLRSTRKEDSRCAAALLFCCPHCSCC